MPRSHLASGVVALEEQQSWASEADFCLLWMENRTIESRQSKGDARKEVRQQRHGRLSAKSRNEA